MMYSEVCLNFVIGVTNIQIEIKCAILTTTCTFVNVGPDFTAFDLLTHFGRGGTFK
jgi:hypothetical protein